MIRTEKKAQCPYSIRNARIAVTQIQRLRRGNHIATQTCKDTGMVESVLVNEVGNEVLTALGIKTQIIGLRGSSKYLYKVKVLSSYGKGGVWSSDSLQAVLANKVFFNQALAMDLLPSRSAVSTLQRMAA